LATTIPTFGVGCLATTLPADGVAVRVGCLATTLPAVGVAVRVGC